MVRLSVNLNKIALLRNSRGGNIPDVLQAARTCIAAGCHGITVHPRPDARHITTDDVLNLAAMLTVEFNIEGYPSPAFLGLVERVKPTQATLVPDPPNVLTSNAGWNLMGHADWLRDVLARLRDAGVRSSLFLEPDPQHIERARELGADRIELYTGPYANAFGTPAGEQILRAHGDAARLARMIGLGVNAGHDLDLKNIPAYVRAVKGLQETSIGHAIVNDALYMGLRRTVRAYLKALGLRPRKAPTKRIKRRS
jgi:pyridoxine 5-phosphate synthase